MTVDDPLLTEQSWRGMPVSEFLDRFRSAPVIAGMLVLIEAEMSRYRTQYGERALMPLLRLSDHKLAGYRPSYPVDSYGLWWSDLSWTALYRYYNEFGGLIYVGITGDIDKRIEQHDKYSTFGPHATLIQYTWISNRYRAAQQEWQLITRYRPPFNSQNEPDWNNCAARLHTPMGSFDHPHHRSIAWSTSHPGTSFVEHHQPHEQGKRCWNCISQRSLAKLLNGGEVKSFAPGLLPLSCPHPRQQEVSA